MKILFLPGTYSGPAANFRYFQLKPSLIENNIQCYQIVLFPRRTFYLNNMFLNKLFSLIRIIHAVILIPILPFFDAVVSIRDILPNNRVFFLESLYRIFSRKYISDFDDTFFNGEKKNKAIHTIKNSSKVVVGNAYLADFVKRHNSNITIIPTVIDTNLFKAIDRPMINRHEIPIIVWTGSKGTREKHLPIIWPILDQLSSIFEFKFRVIADSSPFGHFKTDYETEFIKWDKDDPTNGLRDASIGIMPLVKEDFELGKCGFKLIQYGAVGLPSIATNWGVNNEIILDGVNGFLCDADDDWIDRLATLLNDTYLCKFQGINARQRVVEFYSLNVAIEKWIEVLK